MYVIKSYIMMDMIFILDGEGGFESYEAGVVIDMILGKKVVPLSL